ncbi:hypothetical protein ACWIG3_16000 [Streptomyces celluloflavus]
MAGADRAVRSLTRTPSLGTLPTTPHEAICKEAYPEAVTQAPANFADLRQRLQTQPHPNAETSAHEP